VEKLGNLRALCESANHSNFYDDTLFKYLLDQGFILPETTDEKAIVKKLYQETRQSAQGLNLVVCSTLSCNFGCDYCFQGVDKPLTPMSREVIDQTAVFYERLIGARPEIKNMQMIWYGGEPLMSPRVIYEIADKLIDINIKANVKYSASMVSNGFMMTRDVAQKLLLRGLQSVQITLDGSKEYHDSRRYLLNKKGTYDKILKNIKEWIDDLPIHVNIRVNIDERNKDGITNLIDDLHQMGLSGRRNFKMYFSPVETNTTGCHNVSDLTMQKMQYGQLEAFLYKYAFAKELVDLPYPGRFLGVCSALRPNDYIIVPNGDVHKCWDTVSFPEKRIGTVYDIDAILARRNPNQQLWDAFDPFENEICSSCKLLPNCASYCAHKFVYAKDSAGDSVLPCPSIKYSIFERLVHRAEMDGFITEADYDKDDIKTNPYELTPKMHTIESMKKIKTPVFSELPVLA
jgi:uncharacterized protein